MTALPDPIARLRDVVKYQPNFRGSRNDLLFLLDTITELQDDSDVESVRHALQTSEARVDRLTAALRKYGHHKVDCENVVQWWMQESDVGPCTCGFEAALVPADQEPQS